ncbi:MAG: hypothetical protein KF744_00210 [Taibaiella sp.]|nr:hypothetical protein [Taibaiella sp.]
MTKGGNKILTCAWLLTAPAMLPLAASGQFMPQHPKHLVRLANEDRKNIQLKNILADPRLVSARASCEVTGFTFSCKPEWGKSYGPVNIAGSRLGKDEVAYLKSMSNTNVKITLEDIHLSCNGKNTTEEPLIVTSFP